MPLKAAAIEIRLTAVRTYIQTPSITTAAVKRATGIPQAEKYINKYDVVSIPDQPERLVFREKVGTALTDYKVVSSYEECYDVLLKVHDFGHVKRNTLHGKMQLQFGKSIPLWLCVQFTAVCPECVRRSKCKKRKAGYRPIVTNGFGVRANVPERMSYREEYRASLSSISSLQSDYEQLAQRLVAAESLLKANNISFVEQPLSVEERSITQEHGCPDPPLNMRDPSTTEDGSPINDAGQGELCEHLTVELCMWEEEWRLNGGQALCGMSPTELALDLSLRQHVQSQQYRQYLMNFGKDLQNMTDNQIRLFKNPLHVIEIKRWYQRQQFPDMSEVEGDERSRQGKVCCHCSEIGKRDSP